MVKRDYIVRRIDPEDREKHRIDVQRALDRGDAEDARIVEEVFAEWERDQGTQKTVLVCSVCHDRFVTPKRDGCARRHSRRSNEEPSWNQVWSLMKQIQTLQAELDRVLHALEPPD